MDGVPYRRPSRSPCRPVPVGSPERRVTVVLPTPMEAGSGLPGMPQTAGFALVDARSAVSCRALARRWCHAHSQGIAGYLHQQSTPGPSGPPFRLATRARRPRRR